MKVINQWDSPEEPTMNSRCADCNCEDCICDRPPMPAAGPWRTDVENAPKDGTNILLYWQHPILDGTKVMRYMRWDGGVWTDGDLSVTDRWIIAFATINPPEIPNDHP